MNRRFGKTPGNGWRLLGIAVVLLLLAQGCGSAKPGGESRTAAPSTAQAQPANQRFSFIVCGDPQNNYEVFDRILAAARSVDCLIIAGDLTGSGTPTEFENFLSVVRESGVRYYCVPGNHDVASGGVDEIYSRFLGAPYQSFDHKNCHFILLDNSDPARGFYAAQREWAKADLANAGASKPEHVFAVCHVPPGYPYSLGSPDSEAAAREANKHLVPVLEEGGVVGLFCGHMHIYQHDTSDGLAVTVTGGAGAPLHMSPENGGYYHYVRVDIDGKRRSQTVVKI